MKLTAAPHARLPAARHAPAVACSPGPAPRQPAAQPQRQAVACAKKKSGSGKGGGDGPGGGIVRPGKDNGGGTATKFKSPGEVRTERVAYKEETRKIILSLNNIKKVTPTGKEILKNINLGMYLGAKIGVLGANGAGAGG
ncbi:hypothetical protein QJQ45_011743 [Haematococcus lacustris]|nr:hypothetical protein QJQ45_011743 [Haematococcus lacustris]